MIAALFDTGVGWTNLVLVAFILVAMAVAAWDGWRRYRDEAKREGMCWGALIDEEMEEQA